jgi:hypothetical protein
MDTSKKMTLYDAVENVIKEKALESKNDLDDLCGNEGRQKFYIFVKRLAPEHWERIRNPKAAVRACYQTKLSGYKNYN